MNHRKSILWTMLWMLGHVSRTVYFRIVLAIAIWLGCSHAIVCIAGKRVDDGIGYAVTAVSLAVAITTTPTLEPGAGWGGATDTPAAQGTPGTLGYDQPPIAHWDVAQYDEFTGTYYVGVVAFHICAGGIQKVAFGVDGGDFQDVTSMRLNPDTSVMEYTARLRANRFSAGLIEVRAKVYPVNGEPIVLESLYLTADPLGALPHTVMYVATDGSDTTGNGTSALPFRTIRFATLVLRGLSQINGAIIYCNAGSHVITAVEGGTSNILNTRYLTIMPAPGLSHADVTFTGTSPNSGEDNDGLRIRLVKMTGITMTGIVTGTLDISARMWYDDVLVAGPGRDAGPSFQENQFSFKYITNSELADMQDGCNAVSMWRNCTLDTFAQCPFPASPLVINCTVTNVDREANTDLHPDVYSWFGSPENIILYGVVAVTDIEAFAIRLQQYGTNVAVVGCQFNVTTPYVMELERPLTNILFKNSSFSPGWVENYPGGFVPVDIVYENCTGSLPSSGAEIIIR